MVKRNRSRRPTKRDAGFWSECNLSNRSATRISKEEFRPKGTDVKSLVAVAFKEISYFGLFFPLKALWLNDLKTSVPFGRNATMKNVGREAVRKRDATKIQRPSWSVLLGEKEPSRDTLLGSFYFRMSSMAMKKSQSSSASSLVSMVRIVMAPWPTIVRILK